MRRPRVRSRRPTSRCEKCQKRQFRARNGKFCDSQCPSDAETEGEEQEADLEVNVATEEETSTTTTASSSTSTNPEEAPDTTTVKARRYRGRKNKKNNKNNKNKSKEERKKNRKNRKNKNKKNKKKFSLPLNKEEIRLKPTRMGPLESFIKYLFRKSN